MTETTKQSRASQHTAPASADRSLACSPAARTVAAYALLAALAVAVLAMTRPAPSRSERATEELRDAATAGYTDVIRTAIAHGADVNAGDLYGITPLHRAAVAGQTDAVKELIAHGAHIEAKSFPQGTPLMAAACFGLADTVKVLIDAGADPNTRDAQTGQTPLVAAIYGDSTACIRTLLEAGADPNLPGPNGVTPLSAATDDRIAPEIASLLRRAGAVDPLAPARPGSSSVAAIDE